MIDVIVDVQVLMRVVRDQHNIVKVFTLSLLLLLVGTAVPVLRSHQVNDIDMINVRIEPEHYLTHCDHQTLTRLSSAAGANQYYDNTWSW